MIQIKKFLKNIIYTYKKMTRVDAIKIKSVEDVSLSSSYQLSFAILCMVSVFEFMFILSRFFLRPFEKWTSSAMSYYTCYSILFSASVIGIIILLVTNKAILKYRKLIKLTFFVYAVVLLVWSIAISYLDLRGGSHFSSIVYVTVLFGISSTKIYPPAQVIPLVIGSFIASNLIYGSTANALTGHEGFLNLGFVTNSSVAVVVALVISLYGYRLKVKEWTIVFENIKKNRELSAIANTDKLSGLYNRNRFIDIIPSFMEDVSGKAYFLMLDIDDFKAINDCYGHHAGDVCIESIGKVLSSFSNQSFRMGGEEFLVIGEENSRAEVRRLAERILNEVRTIRSEEYRHLKFTVSIGIYHDYVRKYTYTDVTNKADKALYYVKQHGKNNYRFSDEITL